MAESHNAETLIGLVSQYGPSGEESGAVTWLVERMRSLGFETANIDETGNAVGLIGKGPRQLVLLGHIDTVPGEIPVRLEEIQPGNLVLYGRGSVDAKGPLAAFTDAASQGGQIEGWQLVVIGAIDEERDSIGARGVTGRYNPDYAIIGEPSGWNRVTLGYKGAAWADLMAKRKMSHTASGQESACEAVVSAWNEIAGWVDKYNQDKNRIFEKILLTLRGMHSVDDEFEQNARLSVGGRLPVEFAPDQWYRKIREICDPRNVSTKEKGYPIPAYACDKNSIVVRAFLSAIREQGERPGFVYKTGTADLNIVGPVWRCPMVVYGPGDSSLDHTPDEHISIDEYNRSVAVIKSVIARLTSPSEMDHTQSALS
ncbi:MAG: [LysW]-lysine hydrolase [Anaerolineales bacterium]|nr:[LysW]-lysine hydrolase [Anaerolineales bacterium]